MLVRFVDGWVFGLCLSCPFLIWREAETCCLKKEHAWPKCLQTLTMKLSAIRPIRQTKRRQHSYQERSETTMSSAGEWDASTSARRRCSNDERSLILSRRHLYCEYRTSLIICVTVFFSRLCLHFIYSRCQGLILWPSRTICILILAYPLEERNKKNQKMGTVCL